MERRTGWRLGAVAAACTVLLPMVALSRQPAGAQATGSGLYRAVASGSAVRAGVAVEDFLLISQLVDVGGATAQSALDALGKSDAYAAYPYPGDVAASKSPPFIAHSTAPTQPDAKVDAGGVYTLVAHSVADASSATAHGGFTNGDQSAGRTEATSSTTHDPAKGTVVADATSTSEALDFGDVLRIGRVYSEAKVTAVAGADPKVESTLEVADMSIAGQRVVLRPDGLALPGAKVPLDGTSPLLQALSENDIDVRYVAPTVQPGSVVSAGVEVATRRAVPGVGTAVVTYTFGRSSASATIEGGAGVADVTSSPGDAALLPAAGSSGGGAGIGRPLASSAAGTSPGAVGRASRSPASPVARGERGTVSLGQARPAVARPKGGSSLVGFYLVLVVSGALALGGAQLIRILGVRFAWTS